MDKEPTEIYNQPNTTLDIAFAHHNTVPNNATLIYDIMTDNASNMATLETHWALHAPKITEYNSSQTI